MKSGQEYCKAHYSVGHTMDEAKAFLISKTETDLNGIEDNEMIVNPNKFHLTNAPLT